MDREDVLTILAERPFQPLRIYLADGAFYDVRHPDQALVGFTTLSIAIRDDKGDERKQLHWVSLLHITRVVPI